MRIRLSIAVLALGFAAPALAQVNSDLAPTPRRSSQGPRIHRSEAIYQWQFQAGYEYLRVDSGLGISYNLNGYSGSVTRFFGESLGVEGAASAAFGNPFGIETRFLWYGVGPRYAFSRSGRLQPWVHALFGGARLKISQTGVGETTIDGLSWATGGGVDFAVTRRISWRVEADFVGTRFNGGTQNNARAKTGVAFSF